MQNFSSIFKNKTFYKILLLITCEIFIIAYLPVAIAIFLSFKNFFNSFFKYIFIDFFYICIIYIYYYIL